MTAIRRAELQPLLARFPADIRLLLFAGPDESASHASAIAAIAALSDPADPLAVTSIPADQLKADPGRLADEAASISMFGGRRVIRVDAATDSTADAAALLLAAPAAGNPVVMLAADLPKSSALRKLAEASPLARLLIAYTMEPAELRQWLDSRARALGLTLAPGVADRLATAGAQDIGVLGQELQKFALFLDAAPGRPQRLEPEHLAALGAGDGEEDLFALQAAIIAGQGAEAARQLGLLPAGSAIAVLRQLARKLMQLLELRAAIDAGQRPEAAVRALRPPLFWRDQPVMAAAAGRWPQPMISRALDRLLATEAAIKAPGSPGDVLARQALAQLAAAAAAARPVAERRPRH